ncbi:MAG: cell division protein FtsZ [Bacteroidales bacterium]|nr:cell division protein FtsZ [Bacteroidales bacterium]
MEEIIDILPDNTEPEENHIIKVIGVGGAGGNAVKHMCEIGVEGVNFIVANTDLQALKNNPANQKIQLGKKLTEGLGAGSKPERGKEAALENIDEIREALEGAKMVFITAGMGGGTGTGASPVIAQTAKEMGILTIGVVSIPYEDEGGPKIIESIRGVQELSKCVDSIIVINSNRLTDLYGDLPLSKALANADDVLARATKGLAQIITVYGKQNIDFADVRTAMENSGVAIIGTVEVGGDNRWQKAIEECLNSPLNNNNDIRGAKYVLLNIYCSHENEITQSEHAKMLHELRKLRDNDEFLKWGFGYDDTLEDKLRVTVVATGFAQDPFDIIKKPKKVMKAVIVDGELRFVDPDDEAPIEVELETPKDIKDRIYGKKDENKPQTVDYKNAKLGDPIIETREKLANEEVIARIENIPAIERRMANN